MFLYLIFLIDKLLEENRIMAYGSRFGRVMKMMNSIMNTGRPLAYASELGESARPLVPSWVVRSLYGISWGYVIMDTVVKTYSVKDQGKEKMSYYALDQVIWHSFASMMLPSITIHTIVKYSGKMINKMVKPNTFVGRYGATILGLSSIPFIIHPFDRLTDYLMDKSYRKCFSNKLPMITKIEH